MARISRSHSEEYQQAEADLARDFAANRNSSPAHALHYGAHLATGLAEQRLVSGERLPAPIAIGEDVGEADAGHDLAGSVH